METTTVQEYVRLIIPQSKQQHEFNNKTESGQIRITERLNQIKLTISSNKIETQAIQKREIQEGLKNVLSTFKERMEQFF